MYFCNTSRPLVVAHRGARAHAPENTLAAARLAHALRADLWELDVSLTKDNQLIVMHDTTLKRTTNVSERPEFASRAPWRTCDFTLEEIRLLDAGTWFALQDPFGSVAAGEVTPEALAVYVAEAVPTLEEALRMTRDLDWAVNVEIKDHSTLPGCEQITPMVVDLVRKLDMVERVLISSFHHPYLAQVRYLLPELARGALVSSNVTTATPLEICRAVDATFYHPDHKMTMAGGIRELAEHGIRSNVWTANNIEDIRRIVPTGVNAIISDFVTRTQQIIAETLPE